MSKTLLKPEVPLVDVPQAIRERQQHAKEYFDQRTQSLPGFKPGETIRIQQLPQPRQRAEVEAWDGCRVA